MTGEEFVRQCRELGEKLVDIAHEYDERVAIASLTGVIVSVSYVMKVPRDYVVAMIDEALKDVEGRI